jgi:hypothetical protein
MFGDMGMGGGSPGGGGGGSGITEASVKIGGLELRGAYILPRPNNNTAVTETPEGIFPFPVPEKTAAVPDAEGEATQPSNPLSDTPENVFVKRLRTSRLFSSDTTMTVLKIFKEVPEIKNAGYFVMQVRLEFPLEYFQYSGK